MKIIDFFIPFRDGRIEYMILKIKKKKKKKEEEEKERWCELHLLML